MKTLCFNFGNKYLLKVLFFYDIIEEIIEKLVDNWNLRKKSSCKKSMMKLSSTVILNLKKKIIVELTSLQNENVKTP